MALRLSWSHDSTFEIGSFEFVLPVGIWSMCMGKNMDQNIRSPVIDISES